MLIDVENNKIVNVHHPEKKMRCEKDETKLDFWSGQYFCPLCRIRKLLKQGDLKEIMSKKHVYLG